MVCSKCGWDEGLYFRELEIVKKDVERDMLMDFRKIIEFADVHLEFKDKDEVIYYIKQQFKLRPSNATMYFLPKI